ncbi:xylitol oxidase [Pricia antarctica]|uniref:Xylitol oxidase n=2 Tax=Pricia antarctica TaxID=641691 RepID=A0A1G6YW25_9FLAO|nr:xylitol oxidase [Pricia antarctica]
MSPAITVGVISLLNCKQKKTSSKTDIDMDKVVAEARKNWAGNYSYKAKTLRTPNTVEELQDLIKESVKQKALGSKHCFNNIADSPTEQISTKNLNRLISIDEDAKTVTIESGIRYGELAPQLQEKGYALHNLASLPHISVAGACATATHGSGVTNGNLPSAVTTIELVTADGQIVELNREQPDFYGAVVGLGALGIIARMTLDIEKTYNVRQDLFQNLPVAELQEHFDEIMSSGYSVSLFTDYQNDTVSQVWVKSRTDRKLKDFGSFYGASAATKKLHPITAMPAENCTDQMGVEGPWYERLPHFKMGFTPSSGKELQSEYFVAKENAAEAYMALVGIKDVIFPQLMISEVRSIAADDYWMSPCYKRDCVTFHFTWKQNWPQVRKILGRIEETLSPFGVLPHWGKMFTLEPATLYSRHKKMDDFVLLAKKYDPKGKFRNSFLDLNVYRT